MHFVWTSTIIFIGRVYIPVNFDNKVLHRKHHKLIKRQYKVANVKDINELASKFFIPKYFLTTELNQSDGFNFPYTVK